jgi:hypothetical protein
VDLGTEGVMEEEEGIDGTASRLMTCIRCGIYRWSWHERPKGTIGLISKMKARHWDGVSGFEILIGC